MVLMFLFCLGLFCFSGFWLNLASDHILGFRKMHCDKQYLAVSMRVGNPPHPQGRTSNAVCRARHGGGAPNLEAPPTSPLWI
ncbi:hypothetical protein QBC32DRAFT_349340 [Pseudoneurospora amorphoporcata]|uniref:Secreted protein n=1 Tax=Pseudoneurospora amorphoporcata TaxID=241081 RepID=A0AAN6SD84_9PEZI|nr:hypothetical protein QBC32DRAFT_349340 [Pseudoneurospora amorphoporcata]